MHASGSIGEAAPGIAAAVDFGAAWPAIRASILAVLRGRGVQPADAEDIVQEVAVRALRQTGRFGSEEHLLRWGTRVAANLTIDEGRRAASRGRRELPDLASSHDTASAVERRLALDVLAGELAKLSADDRRLLVEVQPTESRKEAVRLAVRRHRLRARLAAVVEGLVAVIAVLRRPGSSPARAGLIAVPIVAVLAVPLISTQAPGPGRPDVPGADAPARSDLRSAVTSDWVAPAPHPPRPPDGSVRAEFSPSLPPEPIVQLQPSGHDITVSETYPEDPQTACVLEGTLCVDRPGPHVPGPDLPTPLPPS